MRLRVCNVDEEGRFGGPEKRIIQIANMIHVHDIETIVVYPSLDSEIFEKNLVDMKIAHVSLDITRLSREKRILLRYIRRFFAEIKLLSTFFKQNDVDLVHVNGSYQFKVALAGKLSGIPVVWHLNDTLTPAILKNIFKVVSKFCADGFIVAGRRVYEYYLSDTTLISKPIKEIHAPVDTNLFNPEKYIKKNIASCVIATVSGINPTKGVEYFVKMAEKLHLKHPKIIFNVAGAELSSQKSYSAYIKNMIRTSELSENKIKFFGLVQDIPAFLNDADICVFTSISEASPTSVWEAMAMGKAIVTTDVGSVNQYIKDGISGFVVPIKDSDALCERVTLLLENPQLRKEIGKNARKVAVECLGISSASDLHADIYRAVIDSRSKA